MRAIKAIMIDDTKEKQQWFFAIIDHLNETKADHGMSFSTLWTDPVTAAMASKTAGAVMLALQQSNAVYLIDLKLGEHEQEVASLMGMLSTAKQSWAVGVVDTFERIRRDKSNQLGSVFDKHKMGSLVLLSTGRMQAPTMLVSTQAEGDDIEVVAESGYATITHKRFPYRASPDAEPETSRKSLISEWGRRILGLLDPFATIRLATESWFTVNPGAGWNSYERNGLPHNLEASAINAHQHKQCVRKVFKWIPDGVTWWDSNDTMVAFHEALKTFVGAHSQWMGSVADRPLSLAGAYWIVMTAISVRAPNQVGRFLVKNWQCFFFAQNTSADGNATDGRFVAKNCIPFLPPQGANAAKRTVQSLYELLLGLVNRNDGEFGFSDFLPPGDGRPYLSVKLSWTPEDVTDLCNAISGRAAQAFEQNPVTLPSGKATGAFFRFLIASQAASHGFGSRGVVRLENEPGAEVEDSGWLKIGQFDSRK